MVWVSSPWSHLCSDMGIPNGKKNNNTANGVNYFPLLNVVIILTLGPLTSFPRNPIWAKTLSDIQVRKRFILPSLNLIAYKWKFWNSPKIEVAFHFRLTKFLVPEHHDKIF